MLAKNTTCGDAAAGGGGGTDGMADVGSFGCVPQFFQEAAEISADLPSQLLSQQQPLVQGLHFWHHGGAWREKEVAVTMLLVSQKMAL